MAVAARPGCNAQPDGLRRKPSGRTRLPRVTAIRRQFLAAHALQRLPIVRTRNIRLASVGPPSMAESAVQKRPIWARHLAAGVKRCSPGWYFTKSFHLSAIPPTLALGVYRLGKMG
jgi:hypothetical protein